MAELKQKYRVLPAFIGRDAQEGKLQVGTVIYVHPKGRYAVLEFEGVEGKPREAFPLDQLTEKNLLRQKKGATA